MSTLQTTDAESLAFGLLLRHGTGRLPCDVRGLTACFPCLRVMTYRAFAELNGCAAPELLGTLHSVSGVTWFDRAAGRALILYNDELPRTRRRWTLAHELGHVALGHERQDLSYEQAEREADRFAAALLAPPPVLRQLGVTDAEGIAGLCGISFQAARIAAKRLRGNLPAAPPELLKLYIPG